MVTHMSRILLAVDFSEGGDAATEEAFELADRLDASVDVLHVTRPGLEDEAGRRLRHHLSRFHGTAAREVVEAGSPSERIVRYARDHAVDLIVIGTHGNTGVTRALLGSVAERIARTAPCPVMTVPHPARADRAGEGAESRACLVCQVPSDGLVCDSCRARIRAEAAERRQEEFRRVPL